MAENKIVYDHWTDAVCFVVVVVPLLLLLFVVILQLKLTNVK